MLVTLASLAAGCAPATPVLRVTGGAVQGTVVGSTNVFLGVPYAAPPIGERRFAPPQAVVPWQGTKAATAFGPSCPQVAVPFIGPTNQSEDCLTLNVYAPKDVPQHGLPVMVFAHGGSFAAGGSASYPGQPLREATNSVIVTINYRLGALGFLAHPVLDAALGMPSGNMGIRDQQRALEWVHDNIATFGGDPGNVTLFGESAGAVSTCLQMLVSGSASLAHKFIMESGSCVEGPIGAFSRDSVVEQANALVSALCANASDTLACLRSLPTDAFINWKPSGIAPHLAPFWPYVDGALLTAAPARLFEQGRFNHGPFMIGTNRHEWLLFQALGDKPVQTVAELGTRIAELYPAHAPAVLDHYRPASDAQANEAFLRLQTDAYFRCPSRAQIRAAVAQGSRASLYSFDVPPAAHGQEIDYLYGGAAVGLLFPGEAPNPPLPGLVKAMQTYWGSFAATGTPNSEGQPLWPTYDSYSDQNLSLAEQITVESGLARADCDFWDAIHAGSP